MSYEVRAFYAIDDLKKLIHFKSSRGISTRWKTLAYSYLFAFCHAVHLKPMNLPQDFVRVKVSVRETNEQVCHALRITQKIADKLELQTLRPDFEQNRKRRYTRGQGRSTREQYLQNCFHYRLERRTIIEDLIKSGVPKTQIARQLGMSRKRVYDLLKPIEQ
ncbi:MAG: hypothetical protein K0S25_141 [Bacillus sp. (in: firmicutes)]|jgi:hypothetical protein|nr:hypothetical protein [Bacillus sp. (in: firmicutes)]